MSTVSTVAEVLDRAADLIETRGHAKGAYEAADGRLCANGALRVAVFGTVVWPAGQADAVVTLYYAARKHLVAEIAAPAFRPLVTVWNDERTAAEVIAGLRSAARLARDAATT